jgi:hypothetical protein
MRSIHARIPPFRFQVFWNPAPRIAFTAVALRPPLRQCTTMWAPGSSSESRPGS